MRSDPDLGTPSGERLLSTILGCLLNRGQIRLISYIGGKEILSLNRGVPKSGAPKSESDCKMGIKRGWKRENSSIQQQSTNSLQQQQSQHEDFYRFGPHHRSRELLGRNSICPTRVPASGILRYTQGDLPKTKTTRETVCGQTVSELLELLGLPDVLDGIVATARGWICNSILSKRAAVVAAEQPEALQGYFDTLISIYYKLKELGNDVVCGKTVTELIDLLGLPSIVDGLVATARGWICDNILSSGFEKRAIEQPEALQGYFDTLTQIYYKLKELGHDVVCGQTVSELIDLLGLPSSLDSMVATARGWICNSILS
eukprot:sb/3466946/